MSSEWKSKPLNEFILLQRGHDLPKDQRLKGDVPVAGSQGIAGFHNESIGVIPGVTIGRSGSIGATQFFRDRYYPLNTTLYVTDFLENDPLYVYYFFRNFDFSPYNSGSVQPSLNRNYLYTAIADIPPLCEQQSIAHILGTLDDKIELNRKTNETLEGIAKALFKSWFVDFDPVRAKAEGRPTGLPNEISDLFPDSFEESELGEIPSGWKVGIVRDLIERTGMGPFGSRMKTETFKKEGVPIIKGGNLKGMLVEGLGPDFLSEEHAAELESSCVRAGDIVLTHRGTLGQVSMVPLSTKVEKYVASQSQFYLRPSSVAESIFLLYFFHSSTGLNRLLANSSGVGVPSLARPSTLTPEIQITIPPFSLLEVFAEQVVVLQQTFVSRQEQQETLTALRDALLPRLISGELRVPDAEKMLEEVGI